MSAPVSYLDAQQRLLEAQASVAALKAGATAWTYHPPQRTTGYPNQCYYRSGRGLRVEIDGATDDTPDLIVFRFSESTSVKLTVEHRFGEATMHLDAPSLRALHAAIGDALHDIAAVEADRELQESFDRISEEMRDADEFGGPRCYYSHPDIHYVAPGQVEAKVRELEAAGCKRYMVLPNEQIVDAELDGAAA